MNTSRLAVTCCFMSDQGLCKADAGVRLPDVDVAGQLMSGADRFIELLARKKEFPEIWNLKGVFQDSCYMCL